MLQLNDKVGIVACSNAMLQSEMNQFSDLVDILKEIGLVPVLSSHIYAANSVFNGTVEEQAEEILRFYSDNSIKAIFDISGGDVANRLLDYLDYDIISKNQKYFWGYSDLTVIINAIYAKTGHPSCLYQIKNLVWENKEKQIKNFVDSVLDNKTSLFDIDWNFINGSHMAGVVVGGNIRCFLKLAGTPYMPCFKDKILFLESYGGGVAQMSAYLYQLKQLGVFESIAGLLLGTFTKMENSKESPDIIELILSIIDNKNLAIAKTQDIGHSNTSKCLIIGKEYSCGL